jgi:hypothetical protein
MGLAANPKQIQKSKVKNKNDKSKPKNAMSFLLSLLFAF